MGIPLPAGADVTRDPSGAPRRRRRAWLRAAGGGARPPGAPLGGASDRVGRAALRERVATALTDRFPGAQLTGGARVSGSFRLVFGPVVMPSRTPGAPPLITVERAVVRPRIGALLRLRLEPAAIRLEGVRVEAGPRGEALRAELESLARRPARAAGVARRQRAAHPLLLRISGCASRSRAALVRSSSS